MKIDYNKHLCQTLAKSTLTGVRLYMETDLLYYYSVYHLHPDPAEPFLERMLNSPHKAGVLVTPLYQFYGYLTLPDGYTVILGPTKPVNDKPKEMEELLTLLNIPAEKKKEYEHLLHCCPDFTIDRMSWLLAFLLSSATDGNIFPVEQVYMDTQIQNYYPEIQAACLQSSLHTEEGDVAEASVESNYDMELLLMSYIESGQPQTLEEIYQAAPTLSFGNMAHDSLRQIKDAGICSAATSSRAAIAGGMDAKTAFRISDLYIQRFELIRDVFSAEKLIWEMMIDYAGRVQQLKYNTDENNGLFQICANYVSLNIYNPIRVEELAKETGYTRAYLCSQFKKQTGITLSQYILQEKILESQRMLQFTDDSLSEIAAQFSFSSQSHFQSAFKKVTGETPYAFRQRTQKKH